MQLPASSAATDMARFGLHFRRQVQLGSLVLIGLMLSRSLPG